MRTFQLGDPIPTVLKFREVGGVVLGWGKWGEVGQNIEEMNRVEDKIVSEVWV